MRTQYITVSALALAASTLFVGCASNHSGTAQTQPHNDPGEIVMGKDGAQTGDPRTDYTPIADNGATLRVNGMSCPKCANNIERQLAQLNGVDDVQIDLGNGVVSVGFAQNTTHPSRAQLADAIDRTGFTLVSVHAGHAK